MIRALLLSSLLLVGCGKAPAVLPTVLESSATGTVYEIPVEQVKPREIPATPGKDRDDAVVVVTVPPSATATVVRVHRKPKPITRRAMEAITGDSGSPDVSVTADNAGVTAEAQRSVGLWPWIAGLLAVIAGAFAARKWLQRFSWVTRLIGWVKRAVGL